jgi:heme A synthase
MSVTYDETVIVEFANRLYARSTFIVVLYLALGAALGAAVEELARVSPLASAT